MSRKHWTDRCRALLSLLVVAQGCGRVANGSSEGHGGANGGAPLPADVDAGSPGDAGGNRPTFGGTSQGGNSLGGEPQGDAGHSETSNGGVSYGGASDEPGGGRGDDGGASGDGGLSGDGGGAGGGGPSGDGGADPSGGAGAAGGASGDGGAGGGGGAGGSTDTPADIEACLASLVGPADEDVISVRGHAGSLGAVDYTIAGYSAGASGADGLQRFTNSYYGQVGTPAGISDTGLWMWTQSGPVVVGKEYVSGYDVPGGAQLNFRIFANSYTTGVSCPGWGSGHFTYTQFQAGSLLATGGYDFQCPEADIDVRGCFRFVF